MLCTMLLWRPWASTQLLLLQLRAAVGMWLQLQLLLRKALLLLLLRLLGDPRKAWLQLHLWLLGQRELLVQLGLWPPRIL